MEDFNDELDDNETEKKTDAENKERLEFFLREQPEVYKRCIAYIDCLTGMHARPLDHSHPRIILQSRSRCGRAFHNDEVVVEILKNKSSPIDISQSDSEPFGQVVGVLKRSIEPKYRLFVCRTERRNTGLMIPLNRGMPKIYNLQQDDNEMQDGKVLIYRFTKDYRILRDRYYKLGDAASTLFLVRYLKWDAKFLYPLGIVVDVLPAGQDIEGSMTVLNLDYFIPRKFRSATLEEISNNFGDAQLWIDGHLPAEWLKDRIDWRGQLTFTIDSPQSKDLDDALSVCFISGSSRQQLLIGVHIADVSHFLPTNSHIDSEARTRGSSFYPANGLPTPMLPPLLSENLCSLLPNKDRLTLSVFMRVDCKTGKLLKVKINRCVIKSKFRLTYHQVEAVIGNLPNDCSEAVARNIECLNSVAKMWRQKRIGIGEAAYTSSAISDVDSPAAHAMVEEMMIAANHQVALRLVKHLPKLAILRRQGPPDDDDVQDWCRRFIGAASKTVVFNRLFHDGLEVCQCSAHGDCEYLTAASERMEEEPFSVLASTWSKIEKAVATADLTRVRQLVIGPEHHPSTILAKSSLTSIQDRSIYMLCDGDKCGHHSLNVDVYTHFTSPIRRYADLVVHRLLGSVLDSSTTDYTPSEIADLCTHCTDVSQRANQYQRATLVAHLCDLLRRRPVAILAVVADVGADRDIELCIPGIHEFYRPRLKVRLGSLRTSLKPTFDVKSQRLTLSWSKRVYDVEMKYPSVSTDVVELKTDAHIVQIPATGWTKLLRAAVDGNEDKIKSAVKCVERKLPKRLAAVIWPTSEGTVLLEKKHFCDYSIRLRSSNVMMVQLTVELHRGLLRPSVELVHLHQNATSSLSVACCLHHSQDPVDCFAEPARRSAIVDGDVYKSMSVYRDRWLPVLAMEAAQCAVINDQLAVVHNVKVKWKQSQRIKDGKLENVYSGMLRLGIFFCEERCIRFEPEGETNDEEFETEADMTDDDGCCSVGYACIRYSNVTVLVPEAKLPFDRVMDLNEPLTWIGHCFVLKATMSKDKQYYDVHLRLHKFNFPPPSDFTGWDKRSATMEWIAKTLPDWWVEVINEQMRIAQLVRCSKIATVN